MEDRKIIELLKSVHTNGVNTAIRYIIQQYQSRIITKLRIPSDVQIEQMFGYALGELWKKANKEGFAGKMEDVFIEHYLLGVCAYYIKFNLKEKDYKRFKKEISTASDEMIKYSGTTILSFASDESRMQLCKLFGKLGKGCQELLERRFYEGMTYKEIVENTEYTNEETARARASQCLKKLKEWIDDDPDLGNFIRGLLNNY